MILLQERTTSWDIPSLLPFAPRVLVEWIFLGLVAGWLAGKLARRAVVLMAIGYSFFWGGKNG
jgi:hypothetical protein